MAGREICVICLVICSLFFAGCMEQNKDDGSEAENKEVFLYNWAEYTDQSILDDFENETGIRVVLREYLETDQAISEIISNPQDFDVIIATIPVMLELKNSFLLSELDQQEIPNAALVLDQFKSQVYDPYDLYSIPYLWGTAGYAINIAESPYVSDSWDVFWDTNFSGKIYLMDHVRSALLPIQKHVGVSANTIDPSDLLLMELAALKLKDNNVSFGDTLSNLEKVILGEAWVGQVYNGDILYLAEDNPDILYVLPPEGFEFSVDLLMVSAESKHKEAAYQLINYFSQPEISARNVETFYYPSPIQGSETYINPDILNNPLIYPNSEILVNAETTVDIGEAISEYNRIFSSMV